jgi:hypothetical protein
MENKEFEKRKDFYKNVLKDHRIVRETSDCLEFKYRNRTLNISLDVKRTKEFKEITKMNIVVYQVENNRYIEYLIGYNKDSVFYETHLHISKSAYQIRIWMTEVFDNKKFFIEMKESFIPVVEVFLKSVLKERGLRLFETTGLLEIKYEYK